MKKLNYLFIALAVMLIFNSCEQFNKIYQDLDEESKSEVDEVLAPALGMDELRYDALVGNMSQHEMELRVRGKLASKAYIKRYSTHENDLKYLAFNAGPLVADTSTWQAQVFEEDYDGFISWKTSNADRFLEYRIKSHLRNTVSVDGGVPLNGYIIQVRPLVNDRGFDWWNAWYIPTVENKDTLWAYELDPSKEFMTALGPTDTLFSCFSKPDSFDNRLFTYIATDINEHQTGE